MTQYSVDMNITTGYKIPVRLPIKAVRGKPIFIMEEAKPQLIQTLNPTDSNIGYVTDPAGTELEIGQRCLLQENAGAWFDSRDFDWIPEGKQIRIIGTVDPWIENVVVILE